MRRASMLKAGQFASNFELPDSNGSPVTLRSLQERGPVLLAFLKVSCPVCQYTFPFLERIASSGQLPVIGISQDDVKATREFSKSYGVGFPMLLDTPKTYPVSNAFGITSVPSLFLVEPNDTISSAVSGFSRRDLEEIGQRFGVSVFRERETTPEFRPG